MLLNPEEPLHMTDKLNKDNTSKNQQNLKQKNKVFAEDKFDQENDFEFGYEENTLSTNNTSHTHMHPNGPKKGALHNNFFEDRHKENDFDDDDNGNEGEYSDAEIVDDDAEDESFDNTPAADIEENDSEDEGIDDYKIGGYHPVHIGEVLQGRYVVIQKLGWGHFSTVWLCKDFKFDTYVAVKIQKSAPNYMEAAYDEVEILQRVTRYADKPEWIESLKEYYKEENKTEFTRDDCHVVQLLNSFIYQGPYGNHFCMVFEIMGVNLLEIIKRYEYKGVPMHLVRRMAKQILIGLDYLHRICGLIHTDLKPENILLCLTQEEIIDIVENGQLSKNQEYEQRILAYQKQHGVKMNEAEAEEAKKQKKREKKKAQRKKKRNQKNKQKSQEGRDKLNRARSFYESPRRGPEMARYLSLPEVEIYRERKREVEDAEHHSHQKEIHEKDNEIHQKSIQELNDDKKPKQWRGPKLRDDFQLKVVDLGNACWKHHHFSTEIQTRQYRSPEVIIGAKYNETADIWSFACTIFEMLTGDFLFEPKKGPNFGKDDDHLAQIIELVSKIPKKFATSGVDSKKYFDKKGNLKKIQGFHYWPLKSVLSEKYHMVPEEGKAFASFLKPMLNYYPTKRISAQESLRHPWLSMPPSTKIRLTEEEIKKKAQNQNKHQDLAFSSLEELDTEEFEGDSEDNKSVSDSSDFPSEGHDNYGYDNMLNKSFGKGGYVPYGGGIDFDQLDQDPNWQFIDADKIINPSDDN